MLHDVGTAIPLVLALSRPGLSALSLSSRRLRVPWLVAQCALRRMDGLRYVLRWRDVIRRRKYDVPRPNYLWHIDGHHKLIFWGIVIHGIVDGFCRSVSLFFDP